MFEGKHSLYRAKQCCVVFEGKSSRQLRQPSEERNEPVDSRTRLKRSVVKIYLAHFICVLLVSENIT